MQTKRTTDGPEATSKYVFCMQNIQNIHNSKKIVKPKDFLLLNTDLQWHHTNTENIDDDEDNIT